MSNEVKGKLKKRNTRLEAAIEVCEQSLFDLLPDLTVAIDQMTWAEIFDITPHLHKLGSSAVEPFCGLLDSSRKQTAECITTALADIGDARAVLPLFRMMETKSGQANALRARDALIRFGDNAVPCLLEGLTSPKWETRYYCTQAIAMIGDLRCVEPLLDLIDSDRSSKVREAAEEALKLICYTDKSERHKTYDGLYNPLLLNAHSYDEGWKVDVINANCEAVIYKFRLEVLENLFPLLIDSFCQFILSVYEEHETVFRSLDTIALMGDLLDDEDVPLEFGVAFLVSKEQVGAVLELMDLVKVQVQSLSGLNEWSEPSVHWLGQTSLMPVFHMQPSSLFFYDWDESHMPNEVWQDSPENYGTYLSFTSAKAVLDMNWAYRDNIKELCEQGFFQHIPQEKSYFI
jgi:hypothetical protein